MPPGFDALLESPSNQDANGDDGQVNETVFEGFDRLRRRVDLHKAILITTFVQRVRADLRICQAAMKSVVWLKRQG